MMHFRFLHSADIHLDSPLRGLVQYEGAPIDEIRAAPRRAFQRMIDLALGLSVDLVLIAGDIYDGDWKDYSTGLFFTQQMSRLGDADIPVVVISGNHDAASKMTKALRLPPNVNWLSHTQPETVSPGRLVDLGVAVHGRSFAKAAEYDNLALSYPAKRAGMFNIGLLHTSLTGAEGHEPYSPCSPDDLWAKGYDYWALGHVHTRQVIHREPHLVFPGNLQGRHIRESGPKGCYLVSVNHDRDIQVEFHALDTFRWEMCTLDARDWQTPDDLFPELTDQLLELVGRNDDLPLGVRVVVQGPCELHDEFVANPLYWLNQVRASALSHLGDRMWIEKVQFQTTRRRETHRDLSADGPIAEVIELLRELETGDASWNELSAELADLKKKLPHELLEGDEAPRLDDREWLRNVVREIEPLLSLRLQKESGT